MVFERPLKGILSLAVLLILTGTALGQQRAGVLSETLEREIRQTVRDYLTNPTEVTVDWGRWNRARFTTVYLRRYPKKQALKISATWTTPNVGKHLLGVIYARFGPQLRGLKYKTVTLDLAAPFIWKLDLQTGEIITLPR